MCFGIKRDRLTSDLLSSKYIDNLPPPPTSSKCMGIRIYTYLGLLVETHARCRRPTFYHVRKVEARGDNIFKVNNP